MRPISPGAPCKDQEQIVYMSYDYEGVVLVRAIYQLMVHPSSHRVDSQVQMSSLRNLCMLFIQIMLCRQGHAASLPFLLVLQPFLYLLLVLPNPEV